MHGLNFKPVIGQFDGHNNYIYIKMLYLKQLQL